MAERGQFTRREALGMGAGALGGLALVEGLGNLQHTRLNFVNEKDRYRKSEKVVIVFGGYTVDDAGPVGRAIAPAFDVPVLYTVYARNRLDIVGAVNNFLQIRKDTGMNQLTVFGHSEGTQSAGAFAQRLYEEVGDEVEIPRAILDGPTIDFRDTRFAVAGEILADNPIYNGGTFLSMILNTLYYKNPVQSGTAMDGLSVDQTEMLDNGGTYIDLLAKAVRRNRSKVYVLWPENPAADPDVNESRARGDIQRKFPGSQEILVGGKHQGHSNPDHNQDGYLEALEQINAISGGDW